MTPLTSTLVVLISVCIIGASCYLLVLATENISHVLGVNLFFELNKVLAKIITPFEDYNVQIEETHHTQKQDAPSGTAITLAEGIADVSNYKGWTLSPKIEPNKIEIEAKRIENVPGTHKINYGSEIDSIEIIHIAHNRNGFGLGAVVAAEWILGKKEYS